MPVYLLDKELSFPAPEDANEEGIVAVGGDVSPERLLVAYAQRHLPLAGARLPAAVVLPGSTRFALTPSRAHVSRSLRKVVRRGQLRVTADTGVRTR